MTRSPATLSPSLSCGWCLGLLRFPTLADATIAYRPYRHTSPQQRVFGSRRLRRIYARYLAVFIPRSFPCANQTCFLFFDRLRIIWVRPSTHCIMVGITPPYLFTPVNQKDTDPCYNFDPKAVTRASYYSVASSTSSPKPKQEGPLIDFNRHPDSYIIIPSARPNVPPMHPKTKQRINTARWIQFTLRLLQLIGALGALVCVIIIRGVNDVQGWILRIPVSMTPDRFHPCKHPLTYDSLPWMP